MQESPWFSLGYGNQLVEHLAQQYGVNQNKPQSLLVFSSRGVILTKEGWSELTQKGPEALDDWIQKSQNLREEMEEEEDGEEYKEDYYEEEVNDQASSQRYERKTASMPPPPMAQQVNVHQHFNQPNIYNYNAPTQSHIPAQ